MTLAEVNNLTSGWVKEPPLVFLVEALVKGFSGEETKTESDSGSERSIVSDLDTKNDRALQDIAYQAPSNQLPVIHGRADPGLPKTPPEFDVEVMRARNAQARSRAEMWLKVAAMRK